MDRVTAVYKPPGISSYDVIRKIKRTGFKGKIGHAGTLDRFAEGVLIILTGKTTKRFEEIQKFNKSYQATAKIGFSTETLDIEGKIVKYSDNIIDHSKITKIIKKDYIGEINQKIPSYSASKYKGKPRYKYARSSEDIPEKFKKVVIYSIAANINGDEVEFNVECSSGTYIRQLSYDILNDCGVQSHLVRLIRTKVGNWGIEDCVLYEDLESSFK